MADGRGAHAGGESTASDASDSILAALVAPPERSAPPPSYLAGLALGALVVVLLPVVYLLMVAGLARAWWWYAVHGGGLVSVHEASLYALVRFGPLVVGAVLIFFLLKPFLARRRSVDGVCALERSEHPLLFAYVERCCRILGVRAPTRIEVDLEVNASASLARGLPSLFAGDMALTLGLPVVSAFELRELTAVLAHEFGHFSQAAGLRLYHLTHLVLAWLARAAYERDGWDLALEGGSEGGHVAARLVFAAARGCVWISRRVLAGLLRVGAATTALLSRQMEFDADREAVRLCGGAAFASAMRKLPELVLATQWAGGLQRSAFREGRLADDLPELARLGFARLPAELRRELHAGEASAKVDMYADHPPTAERIRRAETLAGAGAFAFDAPATVLFGDYAELCRAVSRRNYELSLGAELARLRLVPSAEIGAVVDGNARVGELVRSFYQGLFLGPLTLALGEPPAAAPADVAAARAELEARRRELWEARRRVHELGTAQVRLYGALSRARAIDTIRWLQPGPRTGDRTIDELAHADARREVSRLEAERDALREAERPLAEALRARLALALSLGRSEEVRARFAGAPAAIERASEAWRRFAGLSAVVPRVGELGDGLDAFLAMVELLRARARERDVQAFLGQRAGGLAVRARTVWRELEKVPYPLDAGAGVTLAHYLIGDRPEEGGDAALAVHSLGRLGAQWSELAARLLAEIAEGCLAIEGALGFEPFPVYEPEQEAGRAASGAKPR